MVIVWVNHYGWVMGGSPEKGLRFTMHKAGAKPFDEFGKELFNTRYFIENKMQCNYDVVRCERG